MATNANPISGKGRVVLGSAVVSKVASFSGSMTMDTEESTSLENEFKMHDTVRGSWTLEISGFAPIDDDTGQGLIEAAMLSGILLTGLKLYLDWSETSADTVIYWQPDIDTEPSAGVYVTSYSFNKDDGSKLVKVSFSLLVSGPMVKKTETIA